MAKKGKIMLILYLNAVLFSVQAAQSLGLTGMGFIRISKVTPIIIKLAINSLSEFLM